MSSIILPEFLFAQVSSFLGDCPEGNFLRKFTGNCSVRDDIKGSTYRNGALHSYDDKPAQIRYDIYAVWYKNGKLHRDGDLPAYINLKKPETFKEWYKNGKLHRDGDLPAAIHHSKQTWYKNGKIHRDGDLPAYIDKDKNIQTWYKHGDIHREDDKPAMIENYTNIYEPENKPIYTLTWFKNGNKHRDNDKPASISGNEEHVLHFLDKNPPVPEIPENPIHKNWLEKNDLHCYYCGIVRQEWYQNGLLHREGDKPSIRNGPSSAKWYKFGKLHRDNGKPALISGFEAFWFIDGESLHKDEKGRALSVHCTPPPYHEWF